ncbi:hypothetical protein GCM10011415_34350 [Salipiger pallidus]|uniref:Uncharacterized protein n=1 Tax=Salipiger pallidus TaxID=1775170 RepID=A0A8J2ZMZ4_9RHOB|nr:hypothetical protein [Salipiger pallidus]GGG81859.1 hypothetical protein GCM10011415_34350 [Salipiger pallidus]
MVLSSRVHELERDLLPTGETVQHVSERLKASCEELQAPNEELQGSKEELHAVNEGLVTVSAEHEHKIGELSSLTTETETLLDILAIGPIVVDSDMKVTQFRQRVAQRFSFEPHDVNRHLKVMGPRLDFIDLTESVSDVIETGNPISVLGHDGEDIAVKVHPVLEGGHRRHLGAFVIVRPSWWGAEAVSGLPHGRVWSEAAGSATPSGERAIPRRAGRLVHKGAQQRPRLCRRHPRRMFSAGNKVSSLSRVARLHLPSVHGPE